MDFIKKLFMKTLKKQGTKRKIDFNLIEKQKQEMQLKYDYYYQKMI